MASLRFGPSRFFPKVGPLEMMLRSRSAVQKNPVDEFAVLFYYRLNTGKEVIRKYMSSNHSEVAET